MKMKMGRVIVLLIIGLTLINCGGGALSTSSIEKDILADWEKWDGETVTGMEANGDAVEGYTILEGVERATYEVPYLVHVEREDGSTNTFTISVNYIGDSNGKNFKFRGIGVY